MGENLMFKAICPLFDFGISQVLIGNHTAEEATEYFGELRKRIQDGIDILDDVKIKSVDVSDLKRLKDAYRWMDDLTSILSRVSSNMFALEILQQEDNPTELEKKIYKILLAMRLYKKEEVFCKVIWFRGNPETDTRLTFLDAPIPETTTLNLSQYSLEIKNIANLRKLADKVNLIDFDKRPTLRIACERFSRSYEEHREDEKIIDFMIAFEALFMKGKEKVNGGGQFIGLGCSMLLGNDDEEREEISQFLANAYKIRNDIVHGRQFVTSSIKVGNKVYEINDFISKLMGYLRESIKKLI
jgi:hypothetical protein